MKPVYHPLRLLWLVPIFFLATLFENPDMVMWFTLTMAFATSKIFPWIEYPEPPKEPK